MIEIVVDELYPFLTLKKTDDRDLWVRYITVMADFEDMQNEISSLNEKQRLLGRRLTGAV